MQVKPGNEGSLVKLDGTIVRYRKVPYYGPYGTVPYGTILWYRACTTVPYGTILWY